MRYWIQLAGKLHGPLEGEQLVLLPSVTLYTMVCPEDRNAVDRKDWEMVGSRPDLHELVTQRQAKSGADPAAGIDGAIEATQSSTKWFLLGGVLLLASLSFWYVPWKSSENATAARAHEPGWEDAMRHVVPLCGKSIQQMAGSNIPAARKMENDWYQIHWGEGSEEIILNYNVYTKEMRPQNQAAQDLLIKGRPCPP